jgi:hypothetical protein
MIGNYRRFLKQLAISAGVAIVTPLAAAGLVIGISMAASTVASAGSDQAVIADVGPAGAPAAVDSTIATHAPTRLSALAGSDDAAWAAVGHAAPKHSAAKLSPPAPCAHPCTDR